jgi:hypothetical protein
MRGEHFAGKYLDLEGDRRISQHSARYLKAIAKGLNVIEGIKLIITATKIMLKVRRERSARHERLNASNPATLNSHTTF